MARPNRVNQEASLRTIRSVPHSASVPAARAYQAHSVWPAQLAPCAPRHRRPRVGGAMVEHYTRAVRAPPPPAPCRRSDGWPLHPRRARPATAGPVPAERWLATTPAPCAGSGQSSVRRHRAGGAVRVAVAGDKKRPHTASAFRRQSREFSTAHGVCLIRSPPPARKHRTTTGRPQRPPAGNSRGLDGNQ